MNSLTLLATNLHCPSCVSRIQDILSHLPGIVTPVEVSLIHQSIRVSYDSSRLHYQRIIDDLTEAAFEIQHIIIHNERGTIIDERSLLDSSQPKGTRIRPTQKHIDSCDACRIEWTESNVQSRTSFTSTDGFAYGNKNPAIINIEDPGEDITSSAYIASLLIDGMSCGSCVGKIKRALLDLPFVLTADIDILRNGGTVTFVEKENLALILDEVKNVGYNVTLADLVEPKPKPNSISIASLSIEGMTCGSCVGNIKGALKDLTFVSKVSIDLMSNSATVEFLGGKQNLDAIIDSIDSAGYEATLSNLVEPRTAPKSRQRVIDIQIDAMHCARCPDLVMEALEGLRTQGMSTSEFQISRPPSLKVPRVQITYRPSLEKGLSVRNFISTIAAVDPAFSVYIYHPPSIEERSKQIQHRERQSILFRLIFTGIVAIPSLIIGVVFMALVPADNATRMWFEEPIWAGNASRIEWALLIMTTPVMFFGTDIFHRRAFKEIWAIWKPKSTVPFLRRFYRFGSMNMLISMGTNVAYFSSLAILIMAATQKRNAHHGTSMSSTYFDAITFLTFFILLGRYLEAYSKERTGDAVAMLTDLRPSEAQLVGKDGSIGKIPVDQLEIGDTVQIPRGHSPPADGLVKDDGVFSFDESSLTGESKPVQKKKDAVVFSGTVNVGDPVKITVSELGGTSMLDQIIDVVRSGQAKRAPIERFADVITGYFVPIVTLLAVVTWVTWLGLGLSGQLPEAWLESTQGGWAFWSLQFAIAVFVVACPCGIGLAAPTALFVGGGLAAREGILVQGGGQAFQEASGVNAIVFDKTGTLTQGQMKVTEFTYLDGALEKEKLLAMAMARAMEAVSSHPIAQAITEFSSSSKEKTTVADIKEIPGYGMTAKISFPDSSNTTILEAAIGNSRLLEKLNEDLDSPTTNGVAGLQEALHHHQVKGNSVAIIAIKNEDQFEPAGIFAISDPLRPEAIEVVASLRNMGLSIHLCTGDNATTAKAIASQLGISPENIRAGVLPQGKGEYIHELQHPREGGRRIVAFVGDGLNDTPALTAADVSISLSSGSDIAINASSFILLNSHLGAIHRLFTLSKRVFFRVKINFFWAAIYNLILIPVAAGVFYMIGASEHHPGWRMSPVWAAIAMAGSSVSVVLSSLALKLPEMRFPGKGSAGKVRQ
ncbi:heavy metal translocatin [Aaosphaeria arxii CBS 175.79]|uniref:Heavy metal translocatin n=1 Tax=Aaosphaeria arxii CBS 175.79 TaxID=1450172 RepID=A0A6A5XIX5_9PLEO|nr:heavy metal translocatin [Aaosphaeria arxii CBS 175.79]KAF2012809.1 heavy metal translocatin [Aaosphaeria arxii CBS 175.79]